MGTFTMLSKEVTAFLIVTSICIHAAWGHGFMWYPWTWQDRKQVPPSQGLDGAAFGYPYPQPDVVCDETTGARCARNSKVGVRTDWYTNYTFVDGEPTISTDMYDSQYYIKSKNGKGGVSYHPWAQPGRAQIFGDGCGVNGGNPNGCQGYNTDTNPYGTCCGGGPKGCGGFTFGEPALLYYADGLFDNAPVNTWEIGTAQPVYWSLGADHRGGYAYRLCKVPSGGVSQITEQCFQNGHLNFVGSTNWVYESIKSPEPFDEGKWKEIPAVRTKNGTFPPGSEWTKINVPIVQYGWGFKDLVQVPANLEPGNYILSFRWDVQRSPQIWNTCANIILDYPK